METSEKTIPAFVLEDLLFQRRLQRTLNAELEKTNLLLASQVGLLQERKELLAEVHAAVQERWQDEQQAENTGEEAQHGNE